MICNDKGLSVSADWRTLPGHLIPEQLNDGANGARGKKMAVYVHGNGLDKFVEGDSLPIWNVGEPLVNINDLKI